MVRMACATQHDQIRGARRRSNPGLAVQRSQVQDAQILYVGALPMGGLQRVVGAPNTRCSSSPRRSESEPYLRGNAHLLFHYAPMWRSGRRISTAMAESG